MSLTCKDPNKSPVSCYTNLRCRCDRCREGHNLYQKERQKEKRVYRLGILNRYKMWKGCCDCGYKENPAGLTFDHVRGTKSFGVTSGVANRTWASIKEEVAKCDVRCWNCHMIRHAEERN